MTISHSNDSIAQKFFPMTQPNARHGANLACVLYLPTPDSVSSNALSVHFITNKIWKMP